MTIVFMLGHILVHNLIQYVILLTLLIAIENVLDLLLQNQVLQSYFGLVFAEELLIIGHLLLREFALAGVLEAG